MSEQTWTWTVKVKDLAERKFECTVFQDGSERCSTSVGTSTPERAAKMALENHLDEDCCGCFDEDDDGEDDA